MTPSDFELLQAYAHDGSQEAFATLVKRHVDLVYSAALRQIRSLPLAEEVAQSAFVELARQAATLKPDTILTAWLYTVTRRKAIDVVRHESSRQLREQIAVELAAMKTSDAHWKEIEPLLDEAMETLNETDRSAILLRYFENKSLREVGESLGASDNAAQKRVTRAVEQLREYFSRNGIKIGGAGLVTLVSANAVQAAPVVLSAMISSTVVLGAAIKTTAIIATAGKTLIMTTTQKVLITTALAAALGTGVYELAQNSRLQNDLQRMEQKFKPLAEQNEQLRRERDEMQKQFLSAQQDAEQWRRQIGELPKLRGEVARLRGDADRTNDSTQVAAKEWLNRVAQLKERLRQNPNANIPELDLLAPEDWLAAVKGQKLSSDNEYRRALSTLRNAGENKFASLAQPVLRKFLEANGQKFPSDLTQLREFFDPPVDDAILQRWQIVPAKNVPNLRVGDWIITEKTVVDDVLDGRIVIGADGFASSDFLSSATQETLLPVYKAFAAEHKDAFIRTDEPDDFPRLLPYATTPEQKAAIQKFIERQAIRK